MEKAKKTENAKLTIVQRWLIRIKGGDEANLLSFHKKVSTFLKRELVKLKQKAESQEHAYNDRMIVLQDSLEDAETELAAAYDNVNPDRIKTNKDATAYVDIYLDGISSSKAEIANIQKAIEETEEDYILKKGLTAEEIESYTNILKTLQ